MTWDTQQQLLAGTTSPSSSTEGLKFKVLRDNTKISNFQWAVAHIFKIPIFLGSMNNMALDIHTKEPKFKLKVFPNIHSLTDIPKCGGGFQIRLLQEIPPSLHNSLHVAVFLMCSSSFLCKTP